MESGKEGALGEGRRREQLYFLKTLRSRLCAFLVARSLCKNKSGGGQNGKKGMKEEAFWRRGGAQLDLFSQWVWSLLGAQDRDEIKQNPHPHDATV